MERKKSLLDDNTNKLDVWRKIISQTENQINWWCLFLTNHRWAALVNKVKKKKNFRALEYAPSFMDIEGKTLGLLLFCILPPQFLKRLLRRLFFMPSISHKSVMRHSCSLGCPWREAFCWLPMLRQANLLAWVGSQQGLRPRIQAPPWLRKARQECFSGRLLC